MALATSAGTRGKAEQADTVRTAAFRFDPQPEAAGRARRATRALLAAWGVERLSEDVDLVVSELVANALLHTVARDATGALIPIRLEVRLDAAALTCRVYDSSPLPPLPEEAGETAESGRGLILVEALSSAWDWQELPEGKLVWASFAL